jgi:hypothetical protein
MRSPVARYIVDEEASPINLQYKRAHYIILPGFLLWVMSFFFFAIIDIIYVLGMHIYHSLI